MARSYFFRLAKRKVNLEISSSQCPGVPTNLYDFGNRHVIESSRTLSPAKRGCKTWCSSVARTVGLEPTTSCSEVLDYFNQNVPERAQRSGGRSASCNQCRLTTCSFFINFKQPFCHDLSQLVLHLTAGVSLSDRALSLPLSIQISVEARFFLTCGPPLQKAICYFCLFHVFWHAQMPVFRSHPRSRPNRASLSSTLRAHNCESMPKTCKRGHLFAWNPNARQPLSWPNYPFSTPRSDQTEPFLRDSEPNGLGAARG